MGSVTKHGIAIGSDLFVEVGTTFNTLTKRISDAHIIGHSKTATLDIQNTYADVLSKPTDTTDKGIHVSRRLIRQSISIGASAFHFYDESAAGMQFFLDHLASGEPFLIEFCERIDDGTVRPSQYKPFFVGQVVIETAPLEFAVGTAVSYDISLLGDGKPLVLNAANLHFKNDL